MQMLIAQEMFREPKCMQQPSNVVAELMGLDKSLVRQSVLTVKGSKEERHYQKNLSGESWDHWKQENSSLPSTLVPDTTACFDESKNKDVHEVQKQRLRNIWLVDKSPQYHSTDEIPMDKRVALVHQKFTEANNSKEFQEAVEVLSSNRDLFLKFLAEPNALFSKNLTELQNSPPASQIRHITVLKSSNMMEPNGKADNRVLLHPAVEGLPHGIHMKWSKSTSSNCTDRETENKSQFTRIVVLKPNLGIPHELKAGLNSPTASSKLREGSNSYGFLGQDEPIKLRKVAKEITQQMQGYVNRKEKDEILLSSFLSNGYAGDESSLNRLEHECIKECDIASDSESAAPASTSQYYWDYSFGLGSPYSTPPYLPESPVIKEAKKRLSERLAMVSSSGISQKQPQVQGSSSTLGEMLSITEVKKERTPNLPTPSSRLYNGEDDQRTSVKYLSIGGMKEEYNEDAHKNVTRSKSVPISSSIFKSIGLREKVSSYIVRKSVVPKEVVGKSTGGASSFKEKVSSLLLSRIKKAKREKAIPSCFLGFEHSEASCFTGFYHSEAAGKRNDASSESFRHSHFEESISVNSEGMTEKISSSSISWNVAKQGSTTLRASLSFEKSKISENSRENQDQASPISVLEAPFQDDASSSIFHPSASIISGHPYALSRSPPIGSISRTLAWELPREIQVHDSVKPSRVLTRECEVQEHSQLIQELLSHSKISDNAECSTILVGWHSLDSPLDPNLLDKCLDRKEGEGKWRERRSNQRLLFDCVNDVLFSIGQTVLLASNPWLPSYGWSSMEGLRCEPLAQKVSRLVMDLFSYKRRQVSGEAESRNLAVDNLMKAEIVGRGWAESMCLEVDKFSREIGGKVLEELVEEALADLAGGCL